MSRTAKLLVLGTAAAATALVLYVLVSVFERQQEARAPAHFRVAEIAPGEPNPDVWGQSFPQQYESWRNTLVAVPAAEYQKYGRYGGSDPYQKLEKHPSLVRLFAGYPFSLDYREERGHARALEDMLATKRLGDDKPGSCMTCKSPQVPALMAQLGLEQFYGTPVKDLVEKHGVQHSISCADCHDSKTLALTITRPAFTQAMASRGIDVSRATRQEMRTYVCAQCHVEYYFAGPNKTVVFPWKHGLTVEAVEAYYQETGFADWTHAETGAPMIKVQHPDYELYSTDIHARSGVSCADCHMPYTRVGAAKVSSHRVDSPLAHANTSCLTCHRWTEQEMQQRVLAIQDSTFRQMQSTETALLAAMDQIKAAMRDGVSDDLLAEARNLHRRAQLRWDFIAAENSMGFHSPQEAARILGEAADLARQAELAAYRASAEASPRAASR